MNGSIDTSSGSSSNTEDNGSPTSSTSSDSSRYAHLWNDPNSPIQSITQSEIDEAVTSGELSPSSSLIATTTAVMTTQTHKLELDGFGELAIGEPTTTTTVSTLTRTEQIYNVSNHHGSNVFGPEPYVSFKPSNYGSNSSSVGGDIGVGLSTIREQEAMHGFGLLNTSSGGAGYYDTNGLRRDYGFEMPLMSSSPFHSSNDFDETPSCNMNSPLSGSSSVTAALNEITALLGDSALDWSNVTSNAGTTWSPASASFASGSGPGPAIKQTIHYLQLLQEIQDTSNTSQADAIQRNHICALTTTLQQHLLSQHASPNSMSPNNSYRELPPNSDHLERAARFHREVAGLSDARVTWSGNLPDRNHRNPVYSCKVFLGGVPWDITELALMQTFRSFGNVRVEWPGKDGNQPKGYAYVIFDSEKQVKNLLQNCTHDYVKCADYFKLSSRRTRSKDVQVIPWATGDSNFVRCPSTKLDPQKTIFVGALHGMLNAEGLCHVMQELFGGVVYAGIDTDRHKYPIGSGRVTFSNTKSYMKAVSAAFIEIRSSRFTKKVQVDPYLEDATCSICNLQQGPYFCRDIRCFNYFCRTCFQFKHTGDEYRAHRPLMRNTNKQHGGPVSIMPTSFGASSSLTEITHRTSFGSQRFYR